MEIQPSAGASTTAQRPASADTTAATKPAAAPAETAAAVPQPGTVPDMDEVAQAVKEINKTLQAQAQSLEFTIDPETDRTIVKVIDRSTKQVLRQIPTEETLQIARALDRLTGLIISQKA